MKEFHLDGSGFKKSMLRSPKIMVFGLSTKALIT
jgi:hypothetical protein